MNDFELLEAWRAGDRAKGNELVRRFFSSVFRFFRSKLSGDVDDLIQQTFLGLVEGRDRIRQGESLRPYIFSIARNQLLMHLRGRYAHAAVAAPEQLPLEELLGDDPSPRSVLLRDEEQRMVIDALRALPLDLQITLELHYWEGMRVNEIATALDVASGTIKSRLHRGRALLEEALARRSGNRRDLAAVEELVSSIATAYLPERDRSQ